MINDYILQIPHDGVTGEVEVMDSIWSCLDEELRDNIRRISSRFGSLAAFQFLAPLPEIEDMFKDMGTVARKNRIPWLLCPVFGYDTPNDVPLSPIPDSCSTLESIPSIAKLCSSAPEQRGSARLNPPKGRPPRKKSPKTRAMSKPWPAVTVKQATAKLGSAMFVQHVCE